MSAKHRKLRFGAILIWLCLLALGGQVLAQGGTLQIGQNAPGNIDAANGTAQYQFTAAGGEAAMIQVLALQLGFTPTLRVLDPSGVVILNAANTQGLVTLNANVTFTSPGTYTIEVGGLNGSTGQFALSLQPGVPAPPAIPLVLNLPTTGTVDTQTPLRTYIFDTTSIGAVTLTVLSQTPDSGPIVSVQDMSANKAIASIDSSAVGVSIQLPAVGRQVQVSVRAGETASAYSICIGSCAGGLINGTAPGQVAPTLAPPAPQPTAAPIGCSAAPSINGSVNLRSGPGSNYAIQDHLPVDATAQVVAEVNFSGWYEVNYNGQTLWVGSTVVTLSGNCSTLPKIQPPANAPLAPTSTPTTAPTLAATATPTNTDVPKTIDLQGVITGAVGLGGVARVMFTVINIGTGDMTQPFTVRVCVSGQCVDKPMSASVPAGGAIADLVDVPHASPGVPVPEPIVIVVDPNNETGDVNPGNNTMALALPLG